MLILLLAAAACIGGCSTAGPYVTDVAYDGEGNLLITKNTVVFDAFFGVVSTGDSEQTIVIKTPKYSAGRIAGYRVDTSRKDAAGDFVRVPVYEDER
jgi:type IV secretion system protein VirB7